MLISQSLERKILERHELRHVKWNKALQRFEVENFHLSLINSSWGQKDLLKIHNRRDFEGKPIIDNHFEELRFGEVAAKTIELSTRFNYDPKTGMYLSACTLQI